MAFIRRHINILFVLILPVYLYIVQNSIQNKHTHVYANGIVVTHSHPLDVAGDLPVTNHDHTKTEICLYSNLHFDFYEAPVLTELVVDLSETYTDYVIENDEAISFSHFSSSIPRAPPALCS